MNNIKLYIILHLIILAGIISKVSANEGNTAFAVANEQYASGEFERAVENYTTILNQGYFSAELYYNLGNAHFKLGNTTLAILYYEKAKKLAPFDEDIQYNLGIVNTRIIDKIEPIPDMFYVKWYKQFVNQQSADMWGNITIALFIVFLIFISAFFVSRKTAIKKAGFYFGILLLLACVLTFNFARDQHKNATSNNTGILIAPSVPVKSAPYDKSGKNIFVLHEGTKVIIIDYEGDWVKIRLSNGEKGWLQKGSMLVI